MLDAVDVVRVPLVRLADAARGSRSTGNPSQAQGATGKVSVGEDIGQAKLLVIGLGVQVQKVGHVHVGDAKLVFIHLHFAAALAL